MIIRIALCTAQFNELSLMNKANFNNLFINFGNLLSFEFE